MSQLKLSSVLPRPAQASVRAHGTKRETPDDAVSGFSQTAHALTSTRRTLACDNASYAGYAVLPFFGLPAARQTCRYIDVVLSLSYILQWQALGGKFKI